MHPHALLRSSSWSSRSLRQSKRQRPHIFTATTITALALASLAILSRVSASITCALPAGSSYKAGDSIILDWGSDGTSPVVSDITSINATLYCNSNSVKIADVPIPNLAGPYNWTVPSVGNATVAGGTVGTCAQNAFHIEYAGEAAGFLNIVKIPWGPVRCGTITIVPAPNGTITTTTMMTTMASTTTSSTVSPTATATDAPSNSSAGGISMMVIVIIAVVAAILATLAVVAMVVCFRRQRRQRKLDDALMPWTSNAATRFSKVSSMDEPRSPGGSGSGSGMGMGDNGIGMSSVAAAPAAATGVGASSSSYELKPQPSVPQPSRGGFYYPDDGDYGNYGFHQQQQQLLQQHRGGYNNQQQGYDGYNEEESYYNPYYSNAAVGLNQSNPSFYSTNNSGTPGSRVRSPFAQDQYQGSDLSQQLLQHQQQQHQPPISGYFPPPPSGLSNVSPASSMQSYARVPAITGSGLTSGETVLPSPSALTSLPTNSSASSSPKRAPQQTVMQEMGRKEAEEPDRNQELVAAPPTSPTRQEKVEVP